MIACECKIIKHGGALNWNEHKGLNSARPGCQVFIIFSSPFHFQYIFSFTRMKPCQFIQNYLLTLLDILVFFSVLFPLYINFYKNHLLAISKILLGTSNFNVFIGWTVNNLYFEIKFICFCNFLKRFKNVYTTQSRYKRVLGRRLINEKWCLSQS